MKALLQQTLHFLRFEWLPFALSGCLTCVSVPFLPAQPSKKIRYHAEVLKGKKIEGEAVRLLKGAVRLHQGALTIHCDSALFFHERNFLEAYWHVRVVNGTDTIRSERLHYDGTQKRASFHRGVVYTGEAHTLRTEHLEYRVDEKIAHYPTGGTLLDSLNILQSREGYYYALTKKARFRGDIVLTHPRHVLRTEALRYDVARHVATLERKGILRTHDGTHVYAAGGKVDTRAEIARLRHAVMVDSSYILAGEHLYMNQEAGYYEARGNVSLEIVGEGVTLFSEHGEYDKKNGCSVVDESPFMRKVLEEEVLYLQAAFFLLREEDGKKHAYAYPSVHLHGETLTGKAGFATYVPADATIFVEKDPVFWSGTRQITAKEVTIQLDKRNVKRVHFEEEAFVISKNQWGYFDQAKSTRMLAYFSKGALERVEADGNGESIYFVMGEEDTPKEGMLTGMNAVTCGKMTMNMAAGTVETMRFYLSPKGTFYPPTRITEENRYLASFAWREEEKPTRASFYEEKALLKSKLYEEYGISSVPRDEISAQRELNRLDGPLPEHTAEPGHAE